MMEPAAQRSLDADVAVLIVKAPLWIAGFFALIAWGAFNDWRSRG